MIFNYNKQKVLIVKIIKPVKLFFYYNAFLIRFTKSGVNLSSIPEMYLCVSIAY